MKKLFPLFILFLITFSACKKKSDNSVVTVFYNGASHSYTLDAGMFIYQSSNVSKILGTESGSNNTVTLNVYGITTGTYGAGADSASSMLITIGNNTYSSNINFGKGQINISSLDASKSWAEGNFHATVTNVANQTDTVNLSQGSFSVKYEY